MKKLICILLLIFTPLAVQAYSAEYFNIDIDAKVSMRLTEDEGLLYIELENGVQFIVGISKKDALEFIREYTFIQQTKKL